MRENTKVMSKILIGLKNWKAWLDLTKSAETKISLYQNKVGKNCEDHPEHTTSCVKHSEGSVMQRHCWIHSEVNSSALTAQIHINAAKYLETQNQLRSVWSQISAVMQCLSQSPVPSLIELLITCWRWNFKLDPQSSIWRCVKKVKSINQKFILP